MCSPLLIGHWLDLSIEPEVSRMRLRDLVALHGFVTNLLQQRHMPSRPIFALAPAPWSALGWRPFLYSPAQVDHMAGRAMSLMLGERRVDVRIQSIAVQAPDAEAGSYVLRTVTPVSCRHGNVVAKKYHYEPTSTMLTSALAEVALRFGLEKPTPVLCEIITVRAERVRLHGKPHMVGGWSGEIRVECGLAAVRLLRIAEVAGLGGRVGYGFGRITVEAA